jgi:rhodanese-related sulfurtransferase
MLRKILPLALLAFSACTSQPMLSNTGIRQVALTAQRAPVNSQAVVTISPEEARDWVLDPNSQWRILDVRTPDEYTSGHLKGATMINFYEANFKAQLEALDRNHPTILYCRSGNRSAQALNMMRELGFRNVYEIRGGILAWQSSGFPIVN